MRAIRRNFVMPIVVLWATAILCFLFGANPWKGGSFHVGAFYSLVTFSTCAGVFAAIVSEFYRGARVLAKQTHRNLFASTYLLVRRNTRRYGGYLVHIGVVVVFIGLAGAAFNTNNEKELGLHDSMAIGPYVLQCSGFTQDSNLNYDSEYAVLDVSRDGKHLFEMTPEKRVYLTSGQPETRVAIHSVPLWDLYVVYEGTNPSTGQPIIKAFLNPLVSWIWFGVVIVVIGTFVALVPSLSPSTAALRVPSTRTAPSEPALGGGD